MCAPGIPPTSPCPGFPAIVRDIAVVCRQDVSVGKLTDCIRSAGGSTLRDVRFFDVYTGAGIPQGKKSVAFSLTLRSDDATLTDEHAEETVQAILAPFGTGWTPLSGNFCPRIDNISPAGHGIIGRDWLLYCFLLLFYRKNGI